MENPLSNCQVEVLQAISEGRSLGQAATHLCLSIRMVKKELLHAYSTLEATGGAMAVSIAIKKGFIVGPDISQMPFHLLAPHEWGVGKALVYGSSDMMAKRLFVSERTVKNWISSASQKLGISGRVALAGAISKHLLQG